MPRQNTFSDLLWILGSAATASAGVFTLFASFLNNLVPPFEDSGHAVGFATFGTAIALLALSLVIRKRLALIHGKWVGLLSFGLFVASTLAFFSFQDMTRTYVYRYPPSSAPHTEQTRHIRGEIHEQGRNIIRSMTVAQAVYKLGGPDQVNAMGMLWSEQSRLTVIASLERRYVTLAMLLTMAFFMSGIAVWRNSQSTSAPGQPK